MDSSNILLDLGRVLLLYVLVVGAVFAGFTALARAEVATRRQHGLNRVLIFGTGGLYGVSAVLLVFKPGLAVLPAVVAILASLAIGVAYAGKKRMALSESEIALLFILPAVTGIVLFYYYQIAQTAIYSLNNLDHTTKWTWETYVALKNYLNVFRSKSFLGALGFTFYFTVVAVFFEFWIGLGMATATFWVNRRLRGVLRSIIVIPWAIPPIISAAIWKWLFNADVGMGFWLKEAGIVKQAPLFLADPILAIHSVILADVWKMSSMIAILLLGGLAVIPQDLYDAAKVDGARGFMRFRRLTLPLLAPTILVALLFRCMDALRTFDLVYGLTNGGPGTVTQTLSAYAYTFYFSSAKFGLGSAYGMVVFAIILMLSFFYISRIRKNLRFKT